MGEPSVPRRGESGGEGAGLGLGDNVLGEEVGMSRRSRGQPTFTEGGGAKNGGAIDSQRGVP